MPQPKPAPGAKLGLFPGSFDPITNGHLDVIERGHKLFDRVVVAVGRNPTKAELFSAAERQQIIQELVRQRGWTNVEVASYKGLTVDYARSIGATAMLRGLRNVSDLNYEFQLALTNRAIADLETVFVMSGEAFGFTSSTLIKQIAGGGDLSRLASLLPPLVIQRMEEKKRAAGGKLPWKMTDQIAGE